MSLKISRILHAGYIFECDSVQIAFDPIFENPFSTNCYAFPNVIFNQKEIKKLQLDAVFISHYHDDHCSFESLIHLDRNTPIYIYCLFDQMLSWIKGLGFKNVYLLQINTSVVIGSFEVTPRPALDKEVDSIFHIKAAGLNILNVVDSWIDNDTLNLLSKTSWDLILWPFQTMRELEVLAPGRNQNTKPEFPEEWAQQLKMLSPKRIVPSSCQFKFEEWSWYNQVFFPISYKFFQEKITSILPNTKVVRMNPSTSIILKDNLLEAAASLSWIQAVGNQNEDYEYCLERSVPSTAEIAKKFPALSAEATLEVIDFCNKRLPDKYRTLEISEEEIFQNPLGWRLKLYDHEGSFTDFYYCLHGKEVAIADRNIKVSWFTEVPIAKLYAALKNGEALTSMYVRIESESTVAEIIEDPLIRCLFTGHFGSYQEAQLNKLAALTN